MYMQIIILAVGKKHHSTITAAIEDYSRRLQHYTKLEWKLVEAKISSSMSGAQIQELESDVLQARLSPEDTVVLLDERGSELTSPVLAKKLQTHMNRGVTRLVFIIGGAYGVSNNVMQRANFTWSLSPLIFPHQLVRLILAEQLYRAHTILAGEKYHHS